MKIMRPDSWTGGYPGGGRAATIHPDLSSAPRRKHMIWQTPQAQDFRFGFEITMYVAAR